MSADDLFFRRTGDESAAFVLVTLTGDGKTARASLEGPPAEGLSSDVPGKEGELREVLREARDFALLNGLDLRIELAGHDWPEDLGILGN